MASSREACRIRPTEGCAPNRSTHLHVEYAGRRITYDILFRFGPFCEYSNLEYERVPV